MTTPAATEPMTTWRVEIPGWLPPSVNTLLTRHWAAAGKLKKRAYRVVSVACLVAQVPKAKGKRRVSIVATMGPRGRLRDADGLWKVILDALKACGAIVDDGPRWVELGQIWVERAKERSTCITLEDIPDAE